MGMMDSIKNWANTPYENGPPKLIQNVNQQNDPMLDSTLMNQFAQGGDVPKDQVAKVDAGERVLNPAEAHAYHASAAGNAPPTLLGRIADRFHELYNQGAALGS